MQMLGIQIPTVLLYSSTVLLTLKPKKSSCQNQQNNTISIESLKKSRVMGKSDFKIFLYYYLL
jgi:hypothetical protein